MSDAPWLINGRFRWQRLTGVQRYAGALTDELCSRDSNQVEVLCPQQPLTGWKGHIWEQITLPTLCQQQGDQRGLWSPANTGPLRISKQVVTLHDVAPLHHPEWFSSAFALAYRILTPQLARRVNGILTVSECSKNRILETCQISEDQVRVALPGVDRRFRVATEVELQAFRQQHNLSRPYVLALGSLEPRKNLITLVQAWSVIQSRWPDIDLVITGGSNRIFAQADLPSTPQVRLLGYFPEQELPLLYGGSTVFVYPSLYEGFGLPIVEAMACGVPVLTGMDGSLQEAAAGAAVMVEVSQIETIAWELDSLLQDSVRRQQLQQQGLERVKSLSWQQTATQILDILQEFSIY